MTIHKDLNGKPKCGARFWGSTFTFSRRMSAVDAEVTCRHCNGTFKRPDPIPALTENLIGKIIHRSWGYDMTINDFYLIVKQSGKSVVGEKIGTIRKEGDGYGYGAGRETPDPKRRTGEMTRFIVKPNRYDGKYNFIGNGEHHWLHDGGDVYFNTMD